MPSMIRRVQNCCELMLSLTAADVFQTGGTAKGNLGRAFYETLAVVIASPNILHSQGGARLFKMAAACNIKIPRSSLNGYCESDGVVSEEVEA